MKAIYKRRLLRAAGIVAKTNKEEFNMGSFGDDCGTPACVIGHYFYEVKPKGYRDPEHLFVFSEEYFGTTEDESIDLFSSWGCNNAKTGKQAAKYIRAFVKRKEREALK